jgi:hypothetical protein
MTTHSDDVLFKYVSQGNPKSNEDLKRFLHLYPECREEIVDFTATWRAMSILDRILPPPTPDPAVERELLRYAKTNLQALRRRRASALLSRTRG